MLLSEQLAEFRRKVEREAGHPLSELEVNSALFLDDLCRHLELPAADIMRIVGPDSFGYVTRFGSQRVKLREGAGSSVVA